jgi:hypothetical protein
MLDRCAFCDEWAVCLCGLCKFAVCAGCRSFDATDGFTWLCPQCSGEGDEPDDPIRGVLRKS